MSAVRTVQKQSTNATCAEHLSRTESKSTLLLATRDWSSSSKARVLVGGLYGGWIICGLIHSQYIVHTVHTFLEYTSSLKKNSNYSSNGLFLNFLLTYHYSSSCDNLSLPHHSDTFLRRAKFKDGIWRHSGFPKYNLKGPPAARELGRILPHLFRRTAWQTFSVHCMTVYHYASASVIWDHLIWPWIGQADLPYLLHST